MATRYTFDAFDTVVHELQATAEELATRRDSIGAIPQADYDRRIRILHLLSELQKEWTRNND